MVTMLSSLAQIGRSAYCNQQKTCGSLALDPAPTRRQRGKRGTTSAYASVAVAQPYGLVALRFRGIKYWWSGLGLAVLAALYVTPIAAVFRQPALAPPSVRLPALSVPAIGFP